MEKVKDFLDRTYSGFEEKKAALDSQDQKFRTLMEMSDDELRIHNSNERVLQSVPNFYGPNVGESLKDNVRARKLEGQSQEDFTDEYLAAINGINLFNYQHKTEFQSLAKRDEEKNLDRIPDSITPKEGTSHTTKQYLFEPEILDFMVPQVPEVVAAAGGASVGIL